MTDVLPNLSPATWLDLIDREYLDEYVRSGGSAVKVISGPDDVLSEASSGLAQSAASRGYYHASLNPAKLYANEKRPDLHRIDHFFFESTRNVDWKGWAVAQARQYLESRGILLSAGRALGDVEGIAADNGRDPQDLLNQYQREFATPIIRDARLSVEFRAAITALTRAALMPDAVTPTTEEVLLGWLAGRTVPGGVTALKKVQIFERINVGNARSAFTSFCRWLPQTGHAGLVLTLDFRPYEYKKTAKGKRQAQQINLMREAIARGADADELASIASGQFDPEPEVVYSDAAYMQMLTMIRRFIDEIDWFERLFLVILTSPNFYKDKNLDPTVRRCYFDYDALQTRIGQEVHDARHANPAAALVQLGGAE